ncbi:MAG: CBS domain-containing protein [Victivallaceae bacterium]|nr:CBS domain-containing protein [Victivallaceae bacterium]
MKKQTMPDIVIITDCPAVDKDAALSRLAAAGAAMRHSVNAGLSADNILASLVARENESSTLLGGGLFFPHARFRKLGGLSVVFAVPEKPFPAGNGENISLICTLLIPETAPMPALKFISSVAGCVRDSERGKSLRDALRSGDKEMLYGLLNLEDKKILLASDLMNSDFCHFPPDLPLKEATRRMNDQHNAQVVPVTSDGKLIGELSCAELFKLGIPDFFSHLKSVGFIRYFDPFEKYFAVEAKSVVGDVMNRNIKKFPPDSTLIEIVFAMVVQNVPLVYITDMDDRLLGVIDRTVLLERIINL